VNLNYAYLPGWLENNALFRKIFLYRKLYLTKRKFSHFSQYGEDISIEKFFPKKNFKGFYVDVGCFHPVKYNNTYKLYRKGWRGINIDVDDIKIEGFNLSRSHDTNIACAISDTSGEVTWFSNGFYSLTNTLDPGYAKRRGKGKRQYLERKTNANTLSYVIDGTKYKDIEIDFLSVDAEAHDLQVLKSLDFDRYKPKIIAIESHVNHFGQLQSDELYSYITGKGYTLVNWVVMTLIFQRNTDSGEPKGRVWT